MSTSDPKPKRFRRLRQYRQNIKDSYTVSRRTFPWIGWALLGIAVATIALGVALSFAFNQPLWYWLTMTLLVAAMLDMILLSWTVRRASFTQIEGMPGAAKAVLDQVGRGWYLEPEPTAINPKTQDVIWRLVGRPGVVLVVEGPVSRTKKLANDEVRTTSRFLSGVPLHVIHVGTGQDQVRLKDLRRSLRALPTKPTKLTDAEISQVAKRLTSLSAKAQPPIPKGIDPLRARPDRRAMRGR